MMEIEVEGRDRAAWGPRRWIRMSAHYASFAFFDLFARDVRIN